jgi:hypothetical protein
MKLEISCRPQPTCGFLRVVVHQLQVASRNARLPVCVGGNALVDTHFQLYAETCTTPYAFGHTTLILRIMYISPGVLRPTLDLRLDKREKWSVMLNGALCRRR